MPNMELLNDTSCLDEYVVKIKEQLMRGNNSKFKAAVLMSLAYDHACKNGITTKSFVRWAISRLGLSRGQAKRLKDFGTPFKDRVNLDDADDPITRNMSELQPCIFSLLMRFPTNAYEITQQGEVFVTLHDYGHKRTPLKDLTFRDIQTLLELVKNPNPIRMEHINMMSIHKNTKPADYLVYENETRVIHSKNVMLEWIETLDENGNCEPKTEIMIINPKNVAYYLILEIESGEFSGWCWNPIMSKWGRIGISS